MDMRGGWRRGREALIVTTALVVVLGATSAMIRQPGQPVGASTTGAVQYRDAGDRAGAARTPAAASLAATSAWAQYRGDITGTGVNPTALIRADNVASLSLRWSVSHTPGYYSTPAIVGGVVYVTSGLSLFALD